MAYKIWNIYVLAAFGTIGGALFVSTTIPCPVISIPTWQIANTALSQGFDISSMSAWIGKQAVVSQHMMPTSYLALLTHRDRCLPRLLWPPRLYGTGWNHSLHVGRQFRRSTRRRLRIRYLGKAWLVDDSILHLDRRSCTSVQCPEHCSPHRRPYRQWTRE